MCIRGSACLNSAWYLRGVWGTVVGGGEDSKWAMKQNPIVVITRNHKVIWEELHCHSSWQRITMPRSPHWLQWDAPHLLPKLPLPL